jgi:hypothetical protein
MLMVLLIVERERQHREAEKRLLEAVVDKMCLCMPFHEREFFSLWPTHVDLAQNNVDVTHLGRRPPHNRSGEPEQVYFDGLKRLYKKSKAQIRRVERLTAEKKPWIKKLVDEFKGVQNVSLAVYRDGMDSEMPAAISVCRVDERYAWIVALVEHESTGKYRDLLLTHPDVVNLVKRYFQERLWERGVVVLDHGEVKSDLLNQVLG